MRLDKWLWAARFFKTRSLASEAVAGGKVRVNDLAAKPARDIRCGDVIDLQAGGENWQVVVRGEADQRRPAAEARLLYAETEASQQKRAAAAELRRLSPQPVPMAKGRPTKRDRRQLEHWRQ